MKQMIVMRTDLRNTDNEKVRTGKLIAQGAHASLGAVAKYLLHPHEGREQRGKIIEWLGGPFTKICLAVDSEEQLLEVYNAAKAAGLITSLITDNGQTEFGGVQTITCCAIGPDTNENLDPITGGLKLL
ncbi:PTH2 family peptidyl-tRNA hydrolase [Mycolicibacterium sp. BK634]|uniref:aminoacyl-tRNA hydrolase n=1 Tax=Mycolicibacterium sp. BK634 TaxID=2587099 RepID=UPI00161ED920|nr:aminoacyl-tRNA hydrolase [Mycolicibacterium sp. BK634]MBB3752469.1 PTH2 family peptidyl-tRNA hydrolase [Mycolicibacterium sp. BK634]